MARKIGPSPTRSHLSATSRDASDGDPPAGSHPVLTLSLATPLGRVHMAATDRALIRIELPDPNAEVRLKIWVALQFPHASIRCGVSPILKKAATQLEAYFTGALDRFTLPCQLVGTPFQVAVWEYVQEIPFGETRSYRDVAEGIDRPRALRAVGAAQGANPLPVVVPCHRVIGADGALTGYGGGLDIKRWLLDHEAELPERSAVRPARRLHAVPPLRAARTPSSRPRGLQSRH